MFTKGRIILFVWIVIASVLIIPRVLDSIKEDPEIVVTLPKKPATKEAKAEKPRKKEKSAKFMESNFMETDDSDVEFNFVPLVSELDRRLIAAGYNTETTDGIVESVKEKILEGKSNPDALLEIAESLSDNDRDREKIFQIIKESIEATAPKVEVRGWEICLTSRYEKMLDKESDADESCLDGLFAKLLDEYIVTSIGSHVSRSATEASPTFYVDYIEPAVKCGISVDIASKMFKPACN